jgi:hypothetical protein
MNASTSRVVSVAVLVFAGIVLGIGLGAVVGVFATAPFAGETATGVQAFVSIIVAIPLAVIGAKYGRRFAMFNARLNTLNGPGTPGYSGDGGPATQAKLNAPINVLAETNASGDFYIADRENHRIRIVYTNGVIMTFAGTGQPGFSGDGGQAAAAKLNTPIGLAWGPGDVLCFADAGNHRIRCIDRQGVIRTIAGSGQGGGFAGDGGPATSARLNSPISCAADTNGNLYIADSLNHRIRKIDSRGIISTYAGDGRTLFRGDGGPAGDASFNMPVDVAYGGMWFKGDNALHVADTLNHRIRRVYVPPGVLANDEDPDGDSITAALSNDVSNGTLKLNADGTFRYMPNQGFSGVDQFTYQADDGTRRSQPATVKIQVASPYDTTSGVNVVTRPSRWVTVQFDKVTQPGDTTVEVNETHIAAPTGFGFGDPPAVFEIESTAKFSGLIQITIDYSSLKFKGAEKDLRFIHYIKGNPDPFDPPGLLKNPDPPGNVTTKLDTTKKTITATVQSFSSFYIVEPVAATKQFPRIFIVILIIFVIIGALFWFVRLRD